MSDNSSYTDLAQRIEESFAEIEDEAIFDFRETDEEYNALYQQILRLKENNPFIRKVIDGNGEISLSAEEHGVLTEYFRLRFRLDVFRKFIIRKDGPLISTGSKRLISAPTTCCAPWCCRPEPTRSSSASVRRITNCSLR